MKFVIGVIIGFYLAMLFDFLTPYAAWVENEMKKILLLVLFLLTGSVAYGQINFPLSLKVQWTPNPPTEQVEFYIVTIDGASNNVQSTTCNSTLCEVTFIITNPGPHTVTVQAVNLFATSQASSISFTAIAPGKSNNVKITK